jgi:hypothetical protein
MIPTMEEKLEQLMTTFSFEQLSRPDQAYVLGFMSEAEYNACRETLSGAIEGFGLERDRLSPDPAILGRVKAGLTERSRGPLPWRVPPKAVGESRWLPLSAFGILGVIALVVLVWIPVRLSHRSLHRAPAVETAQAAYPYRDPLAPAPKQPARDQINDAATEVPGKAAPDYATAAAPGPDDQARNVSGKYICYNIGRPADPDGKSRSIHEGSDSPGLHSNLLIPDFSPVEASPHHPRSRD